MDNYTGALMGRVAGGVVSYLVPLFAPSNTQKCGGQNTLNTLGEE